MWIYQIIRTLVFFQLVAHLEIASRHQNNVNNLQSNIVVDINLKGGKMLKMINKKKVIVKYKVF